MNRTSTVVIMALVVLGGMYYFTRLDVKQDNLDSQNIQNAKYETNLTDNVIMVLKTNFGDVTIRLFASEVPKTTGNFIDLAKKGFYNGTKFHRVIPGFIVQAGDPFTKDDTLAERWGMGGPGYTIEDEFVDGLSNVRGTIAMANTGQPNTGGSQFFINVVDNIGLDFDKEPLSSKHSVFGRVIDGMDVIDAIVLVPTEGSDRPINPVVIEEIHFIDL